MDTGPTAT